MEDKVLGEENPVKVLLKNLILSFFVSIVLMLILSILLSTTNLEEKIISSGVIFQVLVLCLVDFFLVKN